MTDRATRQPLRPNPTEPEPGAPMWACVVLALALPVFYVVAGLIVR